MPSHLPKGENVFTRSLPGPLKGLVESVFPADDLGIAPTPLAGVIEKGIAPAIAGAAPKLARASEYIPNLPDFVPVGGEEAFNAARQAAMKPVEEVGKFNFFNPIEAFINDVAKEVGYDGLRKLQQRPIPDRLVQAPPRMKK